MKKAKDGVSLLEQEVADLDVAPQVTAEETAQVEAARQRIQELLGALDAYTISNGFVIGFAPPTLQLVISFWAQYSLIGIGFDMMQ